MDGIEYRISYTSKVASGEQVIVYSDQELNEWQAIRNAEEIAGFDWTHADSVHVEQRPVGKWKTLWRSA